MKIFQEIYTGAENIGLSTEQVIQKDRQAMKVFKNELKMLVASDKEKYHLIKANYSNYTSIDVLHEFTPVYAMVECKSNKLPAVFEI